MMDTVNAVEDQIKKLNLKIDHLKIDTSISKEEKEIQIKDYVTQEA